MTDDRKNTGDPADAEGVRQFLSTTREELQGGGGARQGGDSRDRLARMIDILARQLVQIQGQLETALATLSAIEPPEAELWRDRASAEAPALELQLTEQVPSTFGAHRRRAAGSEASGDDGATTVPAGT